MLEEVFSKLPAELHGEVQINVRDIPYYPQKGTYTHAFSMEIDKDISTAHLNIIFTTLGADAELTFVPMNGGTDIDNTIQ